VVTDIVKVGAGDTAASAAPRGQPRTGLDASAGRRHRGAGESGRTGAGDAAERGDHRRARGLAGDVDGVGCNSARWPGCKEQGGAAPEAETLAQAGRSVVAVVADDVLLGLIGIADPLRATSRPRWRASTGSASRS
jgi:hypothetical protein